MAAVPTHDLATAFLHWGVLQISAANAVVILLMVLLFAAALLVPFPRGRDEDSAADSAAGTRDDRDEARP